MKEQREFQTENFDCNKLGGIARVEKEYLSVTGTGWRQLAHFKCQNCYDCGVGVREPNGTPSFNWEECVHPERPA